MKKIENRKSVNSLELKAFISKLFFKFTKSASKELCICVWQFISINVTYVLQINLLKTFKTDSDIWKVKSVIEPMCLQINVAGKSQ